MSPQLRWDELRELLDGVLRDRCVAGVDLVEVVPGLDPTGRTVSSARSLLGLVSRRLAAGNGHAV